MELSEFIKKTLLQIATGIEESTRFKGTGFDPIVNTNMTKTVDQILVTGGMRKTVEFVEFDVAVTANEDDDSKQALAYLLFQSLSWMLAAGPACPPVRSRVFDLKFR